MKRVSVIPVIITGILLMIAPVYSQQYIADHRVANEEALRNIPVEFINKARNEFVLAYPHTSHGTHVSRGMFGLQGYKTGDDVLFGISSTPSESKLEFRDRAMLDYAPEGVTRLDLTSDQTIFIQTTRDYLDAPENASVNVVMWAWSRITDLDVAGNYLPGMDSLINEYGPGGSKIGSGTGLREIPVTFIYMTGHAVKNDNTGPLKPKEQAELITDYCIANNLFCLDYYPIDTHTMDDTYYEDTGDNGDSDTYGGNFYEDWQNSHTLGEDWYENWVLPEGIIDVGEHTTQHITSNRKAYAMWWILARMAGWDGPVPVSDIQISSDQNASSVMTGGELQLSAEVLPVEASNTNLDWGVINGTGSATISVSGLLTGGLPGEVEVVAVATDGSEVADTLALTITDPLIKVTSISLFTEGGSLTLKEGTTLQCSATFLPVDATNPFLEWSVVNGIGSASISSGGLVTALTAGTVEVVATTIDGSNITGSLILTINGPAALLNKKNSNSFELYPNPGHGIFYMDNYQNHIKEIRVFNSSGREVLIVSPSELATRISIELTGYPSGIYNVSVSDNYQNHFFSKLVLIK